MQAAGELVGLVGEFAAGVQAREDQLDAAHLLLRMDVDRHAAAVVRDLQRAVLVQRDVDLLAVAGDRLIDAVVDDLVREVVGALRVGVHARPSPHGLEAGQDLDVGGGIRLAHPVQCLQVAQRVRSMRPRAAGGAILAEAVGALPRGGRPR